MNNSRKGLLLIAIAVASLSIFVRLFSVPLLPGGRDILHTARVISLAGAVGPESLAFDPRGEGPYTGVADGRILKWQANGQGWTEFAVTSTQRLVLLYISVSSYFSDLSS